MKLKRIISLVLIAMLVSSCASIPRATLTMSVKLESQLQAIKLANESLINMVFEEREKQVLKYLDDSLFPEYLEELFLNPDIDKIWQNMVDSADIDYRYEVIVWLNKNIHGKYLETKKSLLLPIQEERKRVLAAFDDEFDMAIRMNTTITRNISSVKDVDAIYEKYASEFVDVNRLDSIVTSTIKKIDKGLDKTQEAIDIYNKIIP